MPTKFCSVCGTALPDQGNFCSKCEAEKMSESSQQRKRISRYWILAPIFFGIIGGIIAYFSIKEDDKRKANRYIVIGIIFTIIGSAGFWVVVLISTTAISEVKAQDPLYNKCLNGLDVQYHVSASLEVLVDGKKWVKPSTSIAGIPADCEKSMVFLDDGTIDGAWTKKYPFEVGHFLWMSNFPLRDMDEAKSKIYADGVESSDFIHTVIQNGVHYKAVFISKSG